MPRLKNQFEFTSGIFTDGDLYYNRYVLTVDFYTMDGAPEDQNIALERISYLIYDVIQHSMFIHEDDFDQINLLTKANVPLLAVPDPGPYDPVILAAIITKMNAIMEGVLVITEAEIVSQINGPLIYVWDPADEGDEVHILINDIDAAKWWASPDPRFGSYPNGVDVDKLEKKTPFPLTWKQIGLEWHAEYTDEDATTVIDAVNGTIIKANFNTTPKKK